jgi:WD40 repeat protein
MEALPVPQFNGQWLDTASLSPDGTRLAVGWEDPTTTEIRVYDLRTGTERSWAPIPKAAPSTGINMNRDNPLALSWANNDRMLLVNWNGMRLLDTSKPGSDLFKNSRPLFSLVFNGAAFGIGAQLRSVPVRKS